MLNDGNSKPTFVSVLEHSLGYLTEYSLEDCGVLLSSQRQTTVALSTIEAEYIAVARSVTDIQWLDQMMKQMSIDTVKPTVLHVDNQAAIILVGGSGQSRRAKHIDVQYHKIQDEVATGQTKIRYVASEEMLADGLTKAPARLALERSREQQGLGYVSPYKVTGLT